MYLNGEGVKQDRGLGVDYIERAAIRGFDLAQYTVGQIYMSYGEPEKARPWWEKHVIWNYAGHGPRATYSLSKKHSNFYFNSDCIEPLLQEISTALFNATEKN